MTDWYIVYNALGHISKVPLQRYPFCADLAMNGLVDQAVAEAQRHFPDNFLAITTNDGYAALKTHYNAALQTHRSAGEQAAKTFLTTGNRTPGDCTASTDEEYDAWTLGFLTELHNDPSALPAQYDSGSDLTRRQR